MHNGVKKYSCDFCHKKFNKRNTLNNHKKLHTGEKPFICPSPGCGMLFVQRTACKTHAKKRHGIEITTYPRNPACPQSEASLAQMSLTQRLEQQQILERLQLGAQQQQMEVQQQLEAHQQQLAGGQPQLHRERLQNIGHQHQHIHTETVTVPTLAQNIQVRMLYTNI